MAVARKSGPMIYKKINMVLYGVLTIVLFFTIPFYNKWLYNKVFGNNFLAEIQHMSIEDRRIMRFGYSYTVYEDIKRQLEGKGNVTLLLPTTDYIVHAAHVRDLVMPEPAVFYYFTGIRAVWANSPDAGSANWVFVIRKPGDMGVMKMTLFDNPDSLRRTYLKYIR